MSDTDDSLIESFKASLRAALHEVQADDDLWVYIPGRPVSREEILEAINKDRSGE